MDAINLAGLILNLIVTVVTVITSVSRTGKEIVKQVHAVELSMNEKLAKHGERLAVVEAKQTIPPCQFIGAQK